MGKGRVWIALASTIVESSVGSSIVRQGCQHREDLFFWTEST